MIIPQKMKARLSDRQELNERFWQYKFEMSPPFVMKNEAGHYVMIQVAPAQMRAYSMTDRPDVDNSFEILVDQQPAGLGVNFLRHLKFGQEVEILAPLGQMVIPNDLDAPALILVATGSGVAPFKSIVTDQLQLKKSSRTLVLLWGMRHDEELFWLEDWQAIQSTCENFTFIPIISQPSENWSGETGHVTDFLRETQFETSTHFYLCGGSQMVEETQQVLSDKAIPSAQVKMERF